VSHNLIDGVEIMAQRKKAPKSKLKERTKARLTLSRSLGALTDPEYLGADVDALVTQRMVGAPKRQLGAVPQFWGRYFKGPGDQNPLRYQAQAEGPVLRANNIRVLPMRSRPITLTAIDLWVRRMACAMRQPLLLHLAELIYQPCKAFSFFSMLKARQGNRSTPSIIEDVATL
jgi:hypothetical protein